MERAEWSFADSGTFAAFEQIKKQLEDGCKESLRIEQLAANHGISASYPRKLFLKHTGRGPKEYQMQVRNELACRYLAYTDYPIKEPSAYKGERRSGEDNGER
ncbi:hypothetical protein [Paenibacillus methanolicus]|uniref:HTH araC/xylS-type domain-containing protein n=1 Tax=Paenibacillus methanolicus TaxID=582686 RepID=A0A5S5CAY4_9BACL|nr:hypothetical protein [Paenibacillus methanolicus]TYP76555.1 hypothetical protein BCM02_103217 [Paenibacillus methanolicus]